MDIKNWKENIEDLFYKTVPNGNKFSNLSKTDIERLKPKITDFIDQLLQESIREKEADKKRLDFLDECNRRLNQHYGTNYGWELILNHNVTRLMLKDAVDLNDAKGGNDKLKSCRDAIDKEMAKYSPQEDKQ